MQCQLRHLDETPLRAIELREPAMDIERPRHARGIQRLFGEGTPDAEAEAHLYQSIPGARATADNRRRCAASRGRRPSGRTPPRKARPACGEPAAILATFASGLASMGVIDEGAAISTMFAVIVLSTACFGLVLLLLGSLKWGRYTQLIPYPVVSDRLRIEPWWSNGDTAKLVVSEYLKYLFAKVRMRFDTAAADSSRLRVADARRS